MNYQERLERLETLLRNGQITRKSFGYTDEDGKRFVCLLSALSPEVEHAEDPQACPADVMPRWLAHLTPGMTDYVSDKLWPDVVLRYAVLARRWHALTPADWQRLEWECRLVAVRYARSRVPEDRTETLAVVDRAVALLERAAQGQPPTAEEVRKLFALVDEGYQPSPTYADLALTCARTAMGLPSAPDRATSYCCFVFPTWHADHYDVLVPRLLDAMEYAVFLAEWAKDLDKRLGEQIRESNRKLFDKYSREIMRDTGPSAFSRD